jgi:hypothetical protein
MFDVAAMEEHSADTDRLLQSTLPPTPYGDLPLPAHFFIEHNRPPPAIQDYDVHFRVSYILSIITALAFISAIALMTMQAMSALPPDPRLCTIVDVLRTDTSARLSMLIATAIRRSQSVVGGSSNAPFVESLTATTSSLSALQSVGEVDASGARVMLGRSFEVERLFVTGNEVGVRGAGSPSLLLTPSLHSLGPMTAAANLWVPQVSVNGTLFASTVNTSTLTVGPGNTSVSALVVGADAANGVASFLNGATVIADTVVNDTLTFDRGLSVFGSVASQAATSDADVAVVSGGVWSGNVTATSRIAARAALRVTDTVQVAHSVTLIDGITATTLSADSASIDALAAASVAALQVASLTVTSPLTASAGGRIANLSVPAVVATTATITTANANST